MQDVAIEEEERGEGLILGGGGDMPFGRQVREKGRHLGAAELTRMAMAMVVYEALDPVQVGLLGAEGIMFHAQRLARLIAEGGYRISAAHGGLERIGQIEGAIEDVAIKKEDGRSGLKAFGIGGQGSEEGHHIGCGQGGRVALVMKEDKAFDPGDMGLFGLGRIMALAQGSA
jgi:hypothetical protein